MNNRAWNSKNVYQTSVPRVLCLCSAGLLRSPTTANVLHQEFGYNTRAAGVESSYALIPVDEVLLEWADEIVYVEPYVYDRARSIYRDIIDSKRNVVLDIPDRFEWNNEELRKEISAQYNERLTSSG